MKTILLIISAILLATQLATATSFSIIGIWQEGTNTVLTVQDDPVPIEKVQEYTAKIGAIDKDLMVMVRVDVKAPSEALLSVLKLIKDAGLNKVCILPWQERNNLDVLSVQIMAKTNEFTETYYGTLHEVDDLLEELPAIESKDKQGEPSVPDYRRQGAPQPEP